MGITIAAFAVSALYNLPTFFAYEFKVSSDNEAISYSLNEFGNSCFHQFLHETMTFYRSIEATLVLVGAVVSVIATLKTAILK